MPNSLFCSLRILGADARPPVRSIFPVRRLKGYRSSGGLVVTHLLRHKSHNGRDNLLTNENDKTDAEV